LLKSPAVDDSGRDSNRNSELQPVGCRKKGGNCGAILSCTQEAQEHDRSLFVTDLSTLSLGSAPGGRDFQRCGRQSGILCMHYEKKRSGLQLSAHRKGAGRGGCLINSIAEEFERFSISILFEKENGRVAWKPNGDIRWPRLGGSGTDCWSVRAGGESAHSARYPQHKLGERSKTNLRTPHRRLARFP